MLSSAAEVHNNLELIRRLSLSEKKSLLQRCAKLMEECGELAQEILIDTKASGTQHKRGGEDGILGETIDVTLVALSIFFHAGGTLDQCAAIMQKKCAKWLRGQEAK